jgi:hypothetical protein
MKITSVLSIAFIAALSVAAWTTETLAARADTLVSKRDPAITRCLARAHKKYPGKYYDWGANRSFVYEDCMFDAGFHP